MFGLFAASCGIYALLRYVIKPQFERRMEKKLESGEFPSTIAGAAIDALTTMAFSAALALAIATGVTLYFGRMNPADLPTAHAFQEVTSTWAERLEKVSAGWGVAFTLLLALALGYSSKKSVDQDLLDRRNRALEHCIQRFMAALQKDSVPVLPETGEMSILRDKLVNTDARIEELEASNSNEEEHKRLKAERQALTYLYLIADISRRPDFRPSLAPDSASAAPRALSPIDRLLAVVFSAGTIRTMNRGAKALAMMSGVLLVPSLLTITAPTVATSIGDVRDRVNDQAWQFAIQQRAAEAMAIVEKIPAEPQQQLSQDDQQAVQQIARVFETSILPRYVISEQALFDQVHVNAADTAEARRYIARREIIGVADASNGRLASPSSVKSADARDSALLDLARRSSTETGPVTPGGNIAESRIEKFAQAHRSAFNDIKGKMRDYLASFQEPVAPQEVRELLVSQIVGELLPEGGKLPGPKIAQQLFSDAVGELSGGISESVIDTSLSRFLGELSQQTNVGEAIAHTTAAANGPDIASFLKPAANGQFDDLLRSPDIREVVRGAPRNFVASPQDIPQEALDSAAKLLASSGYDRDSLVPLSQAMSGFDDVFPPMSSRLPRTARVDMVIQELGSAGESALVQAMEGAAARALSVTAMRSSIRVGGIVIGSNPVDAKVVASVQGFSWSTIGEGRTYQLRLALNSGKTVELGPFDGAIVFQALAYAADSRVVAATMTPLPPVPDRRILLHPALIDTLLGCRAILFDTIADEVSYRSHPELGKQRDTIEDSIQNTVFLYDIARRSRNSVVLGRPYPSNNLVGVNQLRDAEEKRDDDRTLADLEKRSGAEWIDTAVDFDEIVVALKNRSAQFDPRAVEAVAACGGTPKLSISKFLACVRSNPNIARSGNDNLFYSTPTVRTDSGVLELPYRADADLDFLTPEGKPALWPFDFTVRVMVDESGMESTPGDDDNRVVTPWEMTTIHDDLNGRIEAHLAKSDAVAEAKAFKDLRSFTLLQRLFRLALAGQMGDGFPVERLADLARETAPTAHASMRTPRWQPQPDEKVIMVMVSRGYDTSTIGLIQELRKKLRISDELSKMRIVTEGCPDAG